MQRIFKKKLFLYTFLILILLLLLLLYIKIINPFTNTHHRNDNNSHHQSYICNSNEITTIIYNIQNNLIFKLTANHVYYSLNNKITCFKLPHIIILNKKNNNIIWEMSCHQANLHSKTTLILEGYVVINKINNNISTQSIITKQLLINLIKQDMLSNHTTIVHGYYFYSIGSKMHTNLQTHVIKLTGNTYTQYEIKKI